MSDFGMSAVAMFTGLLPRVGGRLKGQYLSNWLLSALRLRRLRIRATVKISLHALSRCCVTICSGNTAANHSKFSNTQPVNTASKLALFYHMIRF